MPDRQSQGYDRVRAHASEGANAKIDQITETNLRRAREEPNRIPQRLDELDREWDLDRAVMIAFAAMGSVAFALGLRRDRRWRFPLAAQVGFLLVHSIVGWSPQAVILRRLGFRTRQEIDAERRALVMAKTRASLAASP